MGGGSIVRVQYLRAVLSSFLFGLDWFSQRGCWCQHTTPGVSQDDLRLQEELTESVFKGYEERKAQFEYRLKRLHEQVFPVLYDQNYLF